MNKKELELKYAIETILNQDSIGQSLQNYFEQLSAQNIRRALFVLANIYPDKQMLPDDEFLFINNLFNQDKYIVQETFRHFIQAISTIHFTAQQQETLINTIKKQFEALCETCTFELDALLVNLFTPKDLVGYINTLLNSHNIAVLQRIYDLLIYESDYFQEYLPEETIKKLASEVLNKIK